MQYLSDAWFAAADHAVQAAPPVPLEGVLVIDQHVDEIGSWRVVIGPAPRITRLPNDSMLEGESGLEARPADATFRQSLATARAIASGETDAHQAFLLGDIRFEGSIETLIEHRASLQWLHQALAPLTPTTTWPSNKPG